MLSLYKGYWLTLSVGRLWQAEITELRTGELLPTMASALRDEGPEVCLGRARAVVDLYLAVLMAPAAGGERRAA